jgi:hypothetical protein
MPVRRSSGQPITPDRQRDFVDLPVDRIRQDQTNWCWAAAAQMVSDFYDNSEVKQCRLANRHFRLRSCCNSRGSNLNTCNKGIDVEDVATVYERLNIGSQFTDGQVTLDALKSEINERRPVEVAFQWNGSNGGGHVVIVKGFDENPEGDYLIVNDPLDQYQRALVSYDSLQNAYGLGQWSWTWAAIQPIE